MSNNLTVSLKKNNSCTELAITLFTQEFGSVGMIALVVSMCVCVCISYVENAALASCGLDWLRRATGAAAMPSPSLGLPEQAVSQAATSSKSKRCQATKEYPTARQDLSGSRSRLSDDKGHQAR